MYRYTILCLLIISAGAFDGEIPLDRILHGGSASAVPAQCDLSIVSWNIERGLQLSGVTKALKQMQPAVILLQEVDLGAKRTGRVNIAEQLARSLEMTYLFAIEFEEHGQGSRSHPAYQGQAILTALPVSSPRIIRFKNQSGFWKPRWYIPNWALFQRRAGGRLALAAELAIGERRIVIYNLHLESRGSEELRLRQTEELLSDVSRYPQDMPILIAGDFNTRHSDPPAVKALLQAGFRKAAGQEITTTHGSVLDWIFVRGPLSPMNATVHRQVKASDHFPLSIKIRNETPDCRP